MVMELGLSYKKIDVCLNDCILYYKDDERKKEYSVYGQPQFKPDMEHNIKQSNVPYKILRYFPLTPRL